MTVASSQFTLKANPGNRPLPDSGVVCLGSPGGRTAPKAAARPAATDTAQAATRNDGKGTQLPAPAASVQTFPVAPGRKPLMPYKTLMWALYRDEDFVMALIGDRKVIAFDIACPGSRKCWPVIWVASIIDYLANRPPTRATDAAIIADVLPGQQTTFPLSYLSRLFTVSPEHVKNLINAGSLQTDTAREALGRGPGVTRWIPRESLVNFLKTARMT